MFFVVDKPRLQRIIAIVREDRSPARDAEIPFLRLKAENTELTISGGGCVSATFPATVYEAGVLFIKTTLFRKLIRSIKGEKFLTFQVSDDGLRFANILMPFRGSNMVLYPNPADAPECWPPPPPKAEQIPERKEPTLFDMDEECIKNQSPPTVAGVSETSKTAIENHLKVMMGYRKKILIMDDDKMMMELLEDILKSSDVSCIVKAYQSFKEMAFIINEFLPDLLIIGYNNIDMRGDDIVKWIKSKPGLNHTKIIGMSGYCPAEKAEEWGKIGIDIFFGKPFSVKEFLREVKRLLGL